MSIIEILFFFLLVITVAAAIGYWKHYKHTSERYFLWFLIYVLCHEILGAYYYHFLNRSNIIFYNFYILFSFSFYFFWFHKVMEKRKWLVYLLTTIFLVCYCYEVLTINSWLALCFYSIIIGTLCILATTISYFTELINADTIINLEHSLKFWVVIGLLLFHTGLITFYTLSQTYYFLPIVTFSLNIIFYGCFLKGFISLKKVP